jgi:hypothetical protein
MAKFNPPHRFRPWEEARSTLSYIEVQYSKDPSDEFSALLKLDQSHMTTIGVLKSLTDNRCEAHNVHIAWKAAQSSLAYNDVKASDEGDASKQFDTLRRLGHSHVTTINILKGLMSNSITQ